MNDPHRKRLAFLLAHARRLLTATDETLTDLEAAFRDEDSEDGFGYQRIDDSLTQLALAVLELGRDAHAITMTARRWNDLERDGSDPEDGYEIDRAAG